MIKKQNEEIKKKKKKNAILGFFLQGRPAHPLISMGLLDTAKRVQKTTRINSRLPNLLTKWPAPQEEASAN
jgi:hypothetical protein